MASLIRRVPGFRSGRKWKQFVAIAGYLTIGLFILAGVGGGNGGTLAFGIESLLIVLLASNAWGVQSRLPVLGSSNRLAVFGGWVGMLFVMFIVLVAVSPRASQPEGGAVASGVSVGTNSNPGGQATSVLAADSKSTQIPPTPAPVPSTATPTPASRIWKLSGKPVDAGLGFGDWVTVQAVEVRRGPDTALSDAPLVSGEEFLVVTVKFDNHRGKDVIVDPAKDFYLSDSQTIPPMNSKELKIPDSLSGTIAKSGSMTGQLVFRVSRYQRYDVLTFNSGKELKSLDIKDRVDPPIPSADELLPIVEQAWQQEDWAAAVRGLDLIGAHSLSSSDWKDKLYVAHYNLGMKLLGEGKRAEAGTEFKKAQDVDSTRGEAMAELTALTPTPTPAPSPTSLPAVGTPVGSGNWAYVVSEVRKQKTVNWSSFGNKTTAKGTWLILVLGIKNLGNKSLALNSWDFELRDGQGRKYDMDSVTSRLYSDFNQGAAIGDSIPPGVAVTTAICFDVNPEASGFKLHLAQMNRDIDIGQ